MKFAQVGYGSQGQGAGKDGEGYTYLVSDNVRTGDTLNPAFRHWKNGKIVGTTGKVLSSTKTTTKKADDIKEQIQAKNEEYIRKTVSGQPETYSDGTQKQTRIEQVFTGKQLGLPMGYHGKKSTHDENGNYITSERERAARGGNVLLMAKDDGNISTGEKTRQAVETFDTYSRKFLKGD